MSRGRLRKKLNVKFCIGVSKKLYMQVNVRL